MPPAGPDTSRGGGASTGDAWIPEKEQEPAERNTEAPPRTGPANQRSATPAVSPRRMRTGAGRQGRSWTALLSMLQEHPCKKKTSPTPREAKRQRDAPRPSDPAIGKPGTSTRSLAGMCRKRHREEGQRMERAEAKPLPFGCQSNILGKSKPYWIENSAEEAAGVRAPAPPAQNRKVAPSRIMRHPSGSKGSPHGTPTTCRAPNRSKPWPGAS